MAKKSNHKHIYVKHLTHRKDAPEELGWDIVNVCSICGNVKQIPFKERIVKVDGRYVWPVRHDDIIRYFGNMPYLQ